MTLSRRSLFASWLLMAGAVAWFAKLGVIVYTDGRVIDSGAAALFYLLGFVLLVLGSTGVGAWLSKGAATWVRALTSLLSPVLFILSHSVLESVLAPLVQGRGPSYWPLEVGVLATAAVWFLVGLWLLTRRDRDEATFAASLGLQR